MRIFPNPIVAGLRNGVEFRFIVLSLRPYFTSAFLYIISPRARLVYIEGLEIAERLSKNEQYIIQYGGEFGTCFLSKIYTIYITDRVKQIIRFFF